MNTFLKKLGNSTLTLQQKRTLRGQALSGQLEAAQKGFDKLDKRLIDSRKHPDILKISEVRK